MKKLLLSLALCTASVAPLSASVLFVVTVDTSSIASTTGNINFQFNPGGPAAEAATATISGFTAPGASFGSASGNFTGGPLPADFGLTNATLNNELLQAITFGSSLQFFLSLSGPAVDSPSGSATDLTSFYLTLYNDTFTSTLLTDAGSPTGALITVDINQNGSSTPNAYPSAPGLASITPVPEPSSIVLSLIGAALLPILRRRR